MGDYFNQWLPDELLKDLGEVCMFFVSGFLSGPCSQ